MTKFVAFLRGINVGGRIIKMADLRICFEKMGFKNVSTILQTGNVLFESKENEVKKLKQQIEAALTATFGYPAKVQVYEIDKLRKIVAAYPFDTSQDAQHYVLFLEDNLATQLAAEAIDLDPKVEAIKASDPVVYWHVQKGMTIKSRFALKYQTKAKYRTSSTNRNIKTLQKIIAKA